MRDTLSATMCWQHLCSHDMSLFKYLTTPQKRLSDPQGSLAVSVPSRAIAEVNVENQQLMLNEKNTRNVVHTISKSAYCIYVDSM